MSSQAFEAFLSTKAVARVFAPSAVVQAMLDVEAALARAQAAEGLLPEAAARAIAGVCKAELFDVDAIVADSARAGSLAIPLVRRLTETVALFDAEAAGHVHWGSTGQDVIDTALALLLRRALALIDRDLSVLAGHLLGHARAHAETPVLARTLMQPAQVVSLGFKALAWIAPLLRSQQALRETASRGLQLQLGGAVGTRSMLGPRAAAIAARMATELRLADPATAWHTQRDELMRLHAEVGILCGTLGKIAQDWSLMAQAEVGELAEPSGGGRGGSSAVPHQRKTVASMVALSAALRTPHRVAALLAAMPQQHERGLGNWQAELAEAAGLYGSAHGAVAALAEAAAGLVVEPARMRRNIEAMQGLVHAELGEDSARHRLDATLGALFSAERAARPAVEIAGPQLEALGAQADRLAASAPWAAWLDPSVPDTETA